MDGGITEGFVVSRRWLLGAAAVSTAKTCAAAAAGSLIVEAIATGANGTTAAAVPVAANTGAPPSLAQFIEAYNQEGPNYYIPVPLRNDWGKYVTPQGNTIYIPYAAISGQTLIETDAHLTGVTHATMQGFAAQGGGNYRVGITGDCTDTDARGFFFSGAAPSYFRVTRIGRQGKFSQEALDGYDGRGWRNLDQGITNRVVSGPQTDTATVDTPFYHLTDKGCVIPIEEQVEFHAAKMATDPNFFLMWDVIPGNRTAAQIRARLVAMRDLCPTTAAFILQPFNEDPWNTAFPGVRTAMIDAFANGHYGSSTWDAPLPGITISVDCGSAGADNTSSPATSAGGRVLFDLQGTVGYSVWTAKQEVPAGAPIGENAYWTREYDVNEVSAAARKWRMIFLKQVCDIALDVFGAERYAEQIFPCVMGQHATSGEIYNQLSLERSYIPGFFDGSAAQKVKGAGCGFYLDESDLNRANFDYANVTPASLEAGIRAAFVSFKVRVEQFAIDCLKMNVVPMMYEGSIAPTFTGLQSASYRGAYKELFRSDAGQALMADFGAFMRVTIPGVVMFYDGVGDKIGTNPSDCFNYYSLRTTWADTQNRRYLGWKQGIALLPVR